MNYDIFFAGVGGQGILTIGEILAETAASLDIPANFYPSKGMAQRGGYVKAQLRIGRDNAGPNIPQCGADMVIAMEQSESLKAIPFIKSGGDFVLYDDIWSPTAVTLGKAAYPALDAVRAQVELAGANLLVINPAELPVFNGEPVRSNLYILGVVLGKTPVGQLFTQAQIENTVTTRFKRGVDANLFALRSGLGQIQGSH